MTFLLFALAAAGCAVLLSAAFWLFVHACRDMMPWWKPTTRPNPEEADRAARQARCERRQLRNFMCYDGSEQEEMD